MFIPLGFGSWLKKFPFIITMITLICVYWSVSFFKVIRESEKKDLVQTAAQKEHELDLTKQVVNDACLVKIAIKIQCDEIMGKVFAEEKKSSLAGSAKPKKDKDQKISDVIDFAKNSAEFYSDIRKPIAEWPEYFKKSKSYSELRQLVEKDQVDVLKKSAQLGFLTSKSFSVINLIRASFTHGNYSHLFGNLVMLILIGVWVEQRMGAILTLLTFITGSFFGLGFQIWQVPDHSVIGSSAGIFAIMGAYFVLFYKNEIRFLFTLFPFYF
ncbi:MAG: rhomboid family intramembrane serine protease, partial [Pseudobdellovibrio sp.]